MVPISTFLLLLLLVHVFYDLTYLRFAWLVYVIQISFESAYVRNANWGEKIITPVYRSVCKCVSPLLPGFCNWLAKFDHPMFGWYIVIIILLIFTFRESFWSLRVSLPAAAMSAVALMLFKCNWVNFFCWQVLTIASKLVDSVASL